MGRSGSHVDEDGLEAADANTASSGANNEKLMVALRIRPLMQEERHRGCKVVAEKVDEKMVVLLDPSSPAAWTNGAAAKKRSSERQYMFDVAFGSDSTQEEVYKVTTRPLVRSVLDGFHACVFAYGATGGGKTFTMVGSQDNPGCMVRAINDLFTATETGSEESTYKVSMSYLEIYNENIRDLLNPGSGYLELRDESKGKNIQVAGLSEIVTTNTKEVMRLLQRGNKERTVEPTAANQTSSRSHALLIVNVRQTAKSKAVEKGAVKTGRLYMVDLAGSERASQTQNQGKRLKEGAHINRSLLALGNCINALAEGKAKYVNYRDSKLTRLLKDALSGNCLTVMIAHISPADKHREESRNTLVYADRAKNITNKVRRNVLDVSYHVSQYQTIITELRSEIGRLKEKIQSESTPARSSRKQAEELKELREEMVSNFQEQMKLRNEIMKVDTHILSLSMEFERNNLIISEWETECAKTGNKLEEGERRIRVPARNNNHRNRGSSSDDDGEEADNDESGFEDEDEAEAARKRRHSHRRGSSDDEPAEVRRAWDELFAIQREQERYSGIRQDLEADLDTCRSTAKRLEDTLPQKISTEEESEILTLLCKVHELEIEKVEMERNSLLKEYEVRRRDVLILKLDKHRSLSDEIIHRQRLLIEALEGGKRGRDAEGHAWPMPPELMELYKLYQQELDTRDPVGKDAQLVVEAHQLLRTTSTLSLRPSGDDSPPRHNGQRLPPIVFSETNGSDGGRLFHRSRSAIDNFDQQKRGSGKKRRNASTVSLSSPESSADATRPRRRANNLPPIGVGQRQHQRDSDPNSRVRTKPASAKPASDNPLPPIRAHKSGSRPRSADRASSSSMRKPSQLPTRTTAATAATAPRQPRRNSVGDVGDRRLERRR